MGIEYLIVNLEADRELEAVEVFASEVERKEESCELIAILVRWTSALTRRRKGNLSPTFLWE